MKPWVRNSLAAVWLLMIYVAAYLLMSHYGGYRVVMSGRTPRTSGVELGDTFAWEPRYGIAYSFHTAQGKNEYRSDFVGGLFLPMIWIDQRWVHRSRPYIVFRDNNPDRPIVYPWPPARLVHPAEWKRIYTWEKVQMRHKDELAAARQRRDANAVARIQRAMRDELNEELGIKR